MIAPMTETGLKDIRGGSGSNARTVSSPCDLLGPVVDLDLEPGDLQLFEGRPG